MFFLEMLSKMASKKFLEGPSMLLTKCLESTNEKSPFFIFCCLFIIYNHQSNKLFPISILYYHCQLFVWFFPPFCFCWKTVMCTKFKLLWSNIVYVFAYRLYVLWKVRGRSCTYKYLLSSSVKNFYKCDTIEKSLYFSIIDWWWIFNKLKSNHFFLNFTLSPHGIDLYMMPQIYVKS